jgi:glycosyltransferase involved in cell wall biosynthesis
VRLDERVLSAVYVHGRPAPHPNRLQLLPTIGADLLPVDFRLPWAHLERPPRVRKALSLLLCAMTFPDLSRRDLLIGDGPQHLPVLMKRLRRLRADQKILPYLAGEFPYFLATGYYGHRKTRLLRDLFLHWDGYLCVGQMIGDLVRQVLPASRHADVLVFQNFIRDSRAREMAEVAASLEGSRIVFVGNGPDGFRIFYKGLDLLCESVARARATRPEIACTVVGDWSPATRAAVSEGAEVSWLGELKNPGPVLQDAALYVHCGRGDAWPNTVMEAMAAGVPALVSEWTGGHEFVSLVDKRLVAPLDAGAFAERIAWYLGLDGAARRQLGARAREIAGTRLSQRVAERSFRGAIRQALDRFGLSHVALPGTA